MATAKRVLYGAFLMAAVTLLILLSLRVLFGRPREVFLLPVSFVLGTAIGGAGLMRRRGAFWPEPVYAGLVSSFVVLLVLQLAFPGLGPLGDGSYPGALRDQARSVLAYFVIGGAGAFVLPLFDPAVRRAGPTPTPWKVCLAGAVAVALVVAVELVAARAWGGFRYSFFGLGVLAGGGIGGIIAAGLGLLLTLVGAHDMGAWTGALGLFTAAFAVLVWIFTGMRWFP